MKREITNNGLWRVENNMEELEAQPALRLILGPKFDAFRKNNKMVLQILHRRVHEIQLKYIEHEETSGRKMPVYAEVVDGQPKEWKYLDSVIGNNGQLLTGNNVAEAYNDEVNAFLNRSVQVTV